MERVYMVIVIGAGQAGLAAAYHLSRKGLRAGTDFLVIDANPGPGGAWRHRWPSLTLGAAHGIHDLPAFPQAGYFPDGPDTTRPASEVVAEYYGAFEAAMGLQVLRPVRVSAVQNGSPLSDDAAPLSVITDAGTFSARRVVSGTGTWDRPYWPVYPGAADFAGRQLHTHDFRSAAEFTGQRVLVVGGGTSAVQFLLQLAEAGARTVWSTRRAPEFRSREFNPDWGREVERAVSERTRAGRPPSSVVSVTGLPLTEQYRRGIEAGILVSRGPLVRLKSGAAVFADGSEEPIDVVLWATGFRASLDQLTPLRLREPGGGILMAADGVSVVKEPRLFLVGYGASASTLGATRAGRAAALAALRSLTGQRLTQPAPDSALAAQTQ